MIDHFFSQPKVLKRLHFGPLGSHIDSFAQILEVQGYKKSTAKYKITIVADFSRWLDQQGFNVTELDEITLSEFLLFRGRREVFDETKTKATGLHQRIQRRCRQTGY